VGRVLFDTKKKKKKIMGEWEVVGEVLKMKVLAQQMLL
jgi:hypothetical protein